MAELFHVQSDFLLGINDELTLPLGGYSTEEVELVFSLLKYFDKQKSSDNN